MFLKFLHQFHRAFLTFQFALSGTANVNIHAQACGLFCALFLILRGFIQVKAQNLGVLPMIELVKNNLLEVNYY